MNSAESRSSTDEASDRRSSMEYTFATEGECCVEEELIDQSINSLYS